MIGPVVLGLLGLVIGSFLACLVLRQAKGESWLFSRSRCDACGRTLGAAELVPLLSAIVLRHRCRTCGSAISPLHSQIELTACIVGVVAAFAGTPPVAVAGAVFGWLLLALAAFDITALLLPNGLNAALAVAGLGVAWLGIGPPLVDRAVGAVVAFAALEILRRGYRLLRGREGLGGGDPKLLAAMACWLGWRALPATLVAASLIGIAYALIEHARGEERISERRLPFGAMLAPAGFVAWFVVNADWQALSLNP